MKKCLQVTLVMFFSFVTSITLAQSGWTAETNPLGTGDQAMIGKVQFVSPTEGWISGGLGDLLHTTDAGANWTVVTPFPADTVWSYSDPALSMSWVNPTHGWKINSIGSTVDISYGAVVQQTTDGGNTWQKKILSTTSGDIGIEIQFVDINNGWILIYNMSTLQATFLRTTDGGNNWLPFNGTGIFYFKDADNGWAFFGNGPEQSQPPFKIFNTTNGGTDWTEQYTDTTEGSYNAIYFSDLQNGWAAGKNGKVIKTNDGGINWTIVTNSGINPDYTSKAVFFLDANNGWISSADGNGYGIVQHTTNGGVSWTTEETPLQGTQGNNSIFSMYFVDAQNGWLTGDYGMICGFTGTASNVIDNQNVHTFSLAQNYPNPFNPGTVISYQLSNPGFVSLKVYNVLGKEVATIVNEFKVAGSYKAEFNARNLSSGIYFYRLTSGNFTSVKKMILMK